MVIGLPSAGRRNSWLQRLGHGVAADVGVVEHEGVARIVAHGFDARDQLVIDHARGAVFQLAHALVDQRDQVGQAIGHRRVAGVADALGIDALEAGTIGVLVLRIDALRKRDHLGEDIEFLRHAGPAGEEDVDDFFEIEQPERQFQIARVEHQRAVAEAAAVLVVDVEQEDAEVRAATSGSRCRSSATPLDLPTPVVPSTAKCLLSISSTST